MGRKLPNPIRLTGNYMADQPKPGSTFIDWNNMKKSTTIIDKDGKEVDLPEKEDRPKTLEDLARKRAARMGR